MSRIRLTESQLHNVIRKCINEALDELDWRTAQSAAEKAYANGDDKRGRMFSNYANQRMNDRAANTAQYNKSGQEMLKKEQSTKNNTYYDNNNFYNAVAQDNEDMRNDWQHYVQGKSRYTKGKGWENID